MKLLRNKGLLVVVVLLTALLFANAATNIIVTKYDVDRAQIEKGDEFELVISFKHVGAEPLGNHLTLVNSAPQDFALTGGDNVVKITNPANLFLATLELKYVGSGNVFSFDIIDDATGETLASDKVVIQQIANAGNADNQSQPPIDSSLLEPQFELVNQPFNQEFITTKKYSLVVQLKNASSYIAKDVRVSLEKGASESDWPFDLAASTLKTSQAQVMYQSEGKFVFDFSLAPTALAKRYNLALKLEFKNSHGDRFSQVIPVVFDVDNTTHLPLLDVVETTVQKGADGLPQSIALTVANGGALTAKNVQIALTGFAANGLTLRDDFATKQIGDIGAGQRLTVNFAVKALPGASGVQTLNATLSYGDRSGARREKSSEIFVESGLTGLTKSLDVSFEREQYYLTAGATLDVVLRLQNRTSQNLEDLTVNVNAEGLQMMSTYIKQIDQLKAGESRLLHFKIAASEDAIKNTYPLRATVSAAGAADAAALAISGITISDDQAGQLGKPKVIIESYDYGADFIMAGEAFPLTIGFKNTSATMGIQNVKASYLSDENIFIPVDSSNAIFIEKIGSGEVVTKTVMVKTKNDAVPKTYTLDFTIAYEDQKGNAYDAKNNPYEEKERISINLKQRNRLEIPQIDLPPMVMVGEPINIDVNFFNMGKSTMYNMLVTMEGDFETRDATNYVGTFEPGKSEYYSAMIIPIEAGAAIGKIIFSFEDADGAKESIEKELTFEVMPADDMSGDIYPGGDDIDGDIYPGGDDIDPDQTGSNWMGYLKLAAAVLLPIIVIVVIVILIKRRNKKRRAALLEIDDED